MNDAEPKRTVAAPGPSSQDSQRTGDYVPASETSGEAADSVRTTPSGPPRSNDKPAHSPPGFEILGELGRGGMGIVFKAKQSKLNRIVALKMILADEHVSSDARQRFQVENRAVARMQHPNIIQVFEVCEWDGQPFCALEFCAAGSLAERLKQGPLPARDCATLVEKLSQAMAHAHGHSVVHRDLKPANILLAGEPGSPIGQCEPKVSDFGLAKQLDEDDVQTHSGAILGTPCYMAPEQALGKAKDCGAAADVWALGGILYACMTGRPPFRGKNTVETLDMVRQHDPEPPSRIDSKLPRDLETICLKCLRKEPEKRYAGAVELAEDLRRFLNFEPILARPMGRAERAARWVRRHPATVIAAASLLIALIGSGIGYGLWKQRDAAREQARIVREANEEKVEYFAGLVRRFGEPEGLTSLSEEDANRRLSVYRFTRKGGTLLRIDIVNSYLPNEFAYLVNPSRWVLNLDIRMDLNYLESQKSWNSRERSLHLLRDSEGKLIGEEMRDAYGQLQWGCTWIDRDRVCRVSEVTEQGQTRRKDTKYLRFVWSADGLAREIWETDADGRTLQRPGQWSGARLEYDAAGSIRKLSCLDERGTETAIIGKATGVVLDRDERDRVNRIGLVDADGKPTTIPLNSASQVKIRYDDSGGMEFAMFDPSDEPAALLFTYHKYVLKFRNEGREIERHYLGLGGTFVKGSRERFDDHGNDVESTSIDAAGRAWMPKGQIVVRESKRYDERGALLEERWFRLAPDGSFLLVNLNDVQTRTREQWHFDAEGKPAVNLKFGFHRVLVRSDEKGNALETTYFDIVGQPMLSSLGRHRGTIAYNAMGKPVEFAYFGTDGRMIRDKNGNVKVTTTYSDVGERLEECFWTLTADGKVVVHYRRDGHGRRTEESKFDSAGRPVLSNEDWHRIKEEYDAAGNKIAVAYFDLDGRPTLGPFGRHRVTQAYDGKGKKIEQVHFGLDGRIARDQSGDIKATFKYDAAGERIESCWWTMTHEGKTALRIRRNGQEKILEEAFFDSAGRPIVGKDGWHRITHEYDTAGRATAAAYFDLNAKPMSGPKGYHRWTQAFDAKGRKTEQLLFGTDGEAARGKEGESRVTWEYDAAGALKETRWWTLTHEGKLALLSRTDARGKMLEQVLFDAKGRPELHETEGWNRIRIKYDSAGNAIETAMFGLDDKPVALKGNTHAKRVAKYDGANLREEAYFDVADKPAMHINGFHRLTREYDKHAKPCVEAFFGLAGEPVAHAATGAHRWTMQRDERGNEIEGGYFGTDGKAMRSTSTGIHRWTTKYDDRNRKAAMYFFDETGKPVENKKGYHRTVWDHTNPDAVNQTYFDRAGKPVVPSNE